jgi:hypothetical protein
MSGGTSVLAISFGLGPLMRIVPSMGGISLYSAWNLEHLLNGGITEFGDVFAKATPTSGIFPAQEQGFDGRFKVF